MNGRTLLMGIGLTLSILCGFSDQGIAASTLAITPSGDGSYVLQGIGVENAAAMDIIVNYDPSSLASPQIAQGAMISGAMVAVNDTAPGIVRMGIIRTTPIQGSGVIATLNFNRTGDAPGSILAMKASFSNIDGKPLPVSARIANQMSPAPDNASASSNQDVQAMNTFASAAPAGSANQSAPLVIAVPLAGSLPEKGKEQTTAPTAGTDSLSDQSTGPRSSSISPDAAGMTVAMEPSGKKIQRIKSVLDRFKAYKGTRTRKALLRLFEQEEMTGFRQDPPVAISDGKSRVRATFISNSANKAAVDVAVMGARLVSLKKDPDYSNTWIAELEPEKDAYQVSLAVSQGEMKMVYPLIIAPKIRAGSNKPDIKTENDFDLYLSGKRPGVTFDKTKGYLNDYIVTANYLAAQPKQQAAAK